MIPNTIAIASAVKAADIRFTRHAVSPNGRNVNAFPVRMSSGYPVLCAMPSVADVVANSPMSYHMTVGASVVRYTAKTEPPASAVASHAISPAPTWTPVSEKAAADSRPRGVSSCIGGAASQQAPQFLGRAGAGEGRVARDGPLPHQLGQCLVQRAHARLRACRDDVGDLVRLLLADQVTDRRRAQHHLARGDAVVFAHGGHQDLGDDALDHHRALQPHLLLLIRLQPV